MGLTGVSIFLAKEKNGKLKHREIIGETIYSGEGLFDVSFTIKRRKKLYFYCPLFFTQKIDIFSLLVGEDIHQ